jgi:hypothetical protein
MSAPMNASGRRERDFFETTIKRSFEKYSNWHVLSLLRVASTGALNPIKNF